jgi:hypothetical protein
MIAAFPPLPPPCFADSLMEVWGGAAYVVFLVLDVCVAVCVYRDARQLEAEKLRVVLFGPWLWTLLALFFSVPAAAFYWAANRSALRPRRPLKPVSGERPGPSGPPRPLPSQVVEPRPPDATFPNPLS